MSDLISRAELFNRLATVKDMGEAYAVIQGMPTVERKTGFWFALEKGDKGYSAGDFKCSVCGEPNHTWIPKPRYCPMCGARMGEQE